MPTRECVAPEPQFPHGMHNTAAAYASSASTDVAVYEDLPGHHLPAVRNVIATTNDVSYHGSANDLLPATSHRYAESDFSGTPEKLVNEDLDSSTKHAGSFEADKQTKEVPLNPAAPEGKALRASSTLDRKKEVVLVDFLRANVDIFVWSPSDMPGIPREVAEHSLDILPHSRAVQQWLRCFDEERCWAIRVELRKLLEAGFIKEVFHPTWLANPVLVKKKNGKWRMCVDYTSLNKACPKVPFPLPRIDQIVDSTTGCELLCFLDSYSRCHQIKMKDSD
jgi:hypothetical protein